MVRLKGFQKLTLIDDALQKWLNVLQIKEPKEAIVLLNEALNRVSTKDLTAEEDLPRFDKSAVDGYALRAQDTTGATQFTPITFQMTEGDVGSKQARQIWTGNPLPKGANAVAMIENTKKTS
ncbi:MAG: molybdopterin molybdenumtransferase MoeA, partial [Candidatus Bathyarchaeota archaeon]|nr:molybdopterin molybdenumtransferase MoeA [Candidatus Bathyarchaeota archaeon]